MLLGGFVVNQINELGRYLNVPQRDEFHVMLIREHNCDIVFADEAERYDNLTQKPTAAFLLAQRQIELGLGHEARFQEPLSEGFTDLGLRRSLAVPLLCH